METVGVSPLVVSTPLRHHFFTRESTIIEWRDAEGWHCDENGRRYSRTYKRPVIKRHYEGLNYHELRHTHFTMRLASGMDIPTAQALGGWSTPAMLMNVYAHPVNENIWNAAGFMDKLSASDPVSEERNLGANMHL